LASELIDALQQAINLFDSRLPEQQLILQQDFSDLARSGATPAMMLERLVEMTGKTGLLQGRTALVEDIHTAVRQSIEPNALRAAISTTDGPAQRWIRDTADATVANVLYLEVPAEHLVRLVAPVWVDGWTQAALSLFARPTELTSRDRVALLVTARLLATITWETQPDVLGGFLPAKQVSMATMAVRSQESDPETVAEAIRQLVDLGKGGVIVGREDVRIWLPYKSADQWNRLVRAWHVQLSADLGRVSIGHTFQRCLKHNFPNAAIIHAAEAALIGDRLFGPGYVTSYAEAQLARLLLECRGASDLGAVYERAIGNLVLEDPKHENGLVRTLEVYCDTFATTRTAEELGVHRNTVLHRLKRIEEITATDLEDASTRLLLQLGLLADRLLRKVDAASSAHREYPHTRAPQDLPSPHRILIGEA
jgi:hypothetical protein